MSQNPEDKDWQEKQIPLKDIVLSNSWAVQAILQYLEELNPGARDRIWEHYLHMKSMADNAQNDTQVQIEEEYYFDEENADDWMDDIDPSSTGNTIN